MKLWLSMASKGRPDSRNGVWTHPKGRLLFKRIILRLPLGQKYLFIESNRSLKHRSPSVSKIDRVPMNVLPKESTAHSSAENGFSKAEFFEFRSPYRMRSPAVSNVIVLRLSKAVFIAVFNTASRRFMLGEENFGNSADLSRKTY